MKAYISDVNWTSDKLYSSLVRIFNGHQVPKVFGLRACQITIL